jgi:hypothetical protein
MPGPPTVIYSAANSQQAYLLKGLLAEQGIAAWVVNDSIQIAGGELPLGWTAAPRVVVSESDAAEARQFAESFDHQTALETPDENPKEALALTPWPDWPICPDCGERRSARCPVCGISATDFPLADFQDSPDDQRVLLYCQACDDHFLPDWYRLCPRCGYDYGDGLAVEGTIEPLGFNWRSWLVLAILVAGAASMLGYVLWLFGWPQL